MSDDPARNEASNGKTPQGTTVRATTSADGRTGKPVKFAPRQEIPNELYADGVGGLQFGRNIVKLDLYRVLEFDRDDAEVRQLAHRLVLPITAIPELVRLLQGFGQAVKDQSGN